MRKDTLGWSPRDALTAYQKQEIDADAVLRALGGYPDWRVRAWPVDDGRIRFGMVRTATGGSLLEVFGDDDAVQAFLAVEGDTLPIDPDTGPQGTPAGWMTAPGWEVFGGMVHGRPDRVNVDLHSPHRAHYDLDQIPLLASWSRIAASEWALRAPERFAHPFGVLAGHPGWFGVLRPAADGEHDVVLAPDPAQRALAALFTAPDTAQAFCDALDAGGDENWEVVQRPVAHWVSFLRDLPIDGLVFNPLSHLPARALSRGVLSVLATAPERPL